MLYTCFKTHKQSMLKKYVYFKSLCGRIKCVFEIIDMKNIKLPFIQANFKIGVYNDLICLFKQQLFYNKLRKT